MDIYKCCPVAENDNFRLRLVTAGDCSDLLKVYSDKKAVPFFNSDNCHGDNFYYTTVKRMEQAVDFWLKSYENGDFVRFAIVDKKSSESVGTIEIFNRQANDYFTNCGLLRLDLRSDYEKANFIKDILSLIVYKSFDWFNCGKIAVKSVSEARERIKALESLGFLLSQEKLIGTNDLKEYSSYYVLTKSKVISGKGE